MKKRMLFEGGGKPTSDGRNVTGKLLSFRSALWNSYQAEDITFKNLQEVEKYKKEQLEKFEREIAELEAVFEYMGE